MAGKAFALISSQTGLIGGAQSRSNHLQMTHWCSRCKRLRGGQDRIGVDTVMAVKIGNGAGLTEVLDAERTYAMAMDGTEPGERGRMPVKDRDDTAMRR